MFLPAVCDRCGAVFQQRVIKIENSTNISLAGVQVGPCPRCGGMGHIPDGVYNVIGQVIEVFASTQHARAEVERIAAIFRQAKERRSKPEEIAERIRREAPAFSGLADLMPKTPTEVAAYVTAVLAAATLAVQVWKKDAAPTINVNQVINQITIQTPAAPAREARLGAERPLEAAPAPKPRQGNYKKDQRRMKKGERQARRVHK